MRNSLEPQQPSPHLANTLRVAQLGLLITAALTLAGVLRPPLSRGAAALIAAIDRRPPATAPDEPTAGPVRARQQPSGALMKLAPIPDSERLAFQGPRAGGVPRAPVARLAFDADVDRTFLGRHPLYLRLRSFDTCSAGAWEQSTDAAYEPNHGSQTVLRHDLAADATYTLYARPSEFGILPLVSIPVAIDSPDARAYDDGTCRLPRPLPGLAVSYRAAASLRRWNDVTSGPLTPGLADPTCLALPTTPPLSTLTAVLARVLVPGTPRDYRLAVAHMGFLAKYRYAEGATCPSDQDPIDYFLSVSGAGNCRLAASSFALLGRLLGFPTRVVTGYCGGEISATDGSVVFFTTDAHAWVEVATHEQGWIPLDPTPPSLEAPPYAPRVTSASYPVDPSQFPSIETAIRRATLFANRSSSTQAPAREGLPAWRIHGLWMLPAAAVSAWAVLLLIAYRARATGGLDAMRPQPRHHPRFLRRLLQALAHAGLPLGRGQTLREYATALQSAGLATDETRSLLEYACGICYAGAPRDHARERAWSRTPPLLTPKKPRSGVVGQ